MTGNLTDDLAAAWWNWMWPATWQASIVAALFGVAAASDPAAALAVGSLSLPAVGVRPARWKTFHTIRLH